jgi:4-hydroxyphenylpyruvate dioxygenase-like putative hemolysin
MSKVMSNGNGRINSNQRTSRRKEKITKEFRLYGGPGIQHIAATDDILKPKSTVQEELSFISRHILTIKQYQNVWERNT